VIKAYWTCGAFDGVLIFEATDEESAMAALITLAQAGNVRTQTLRAFGSDEIGSILAKTG